MKKALIILFAIVIFNCSAYAGFLAGNVSPYVPAGGHYAFDVSTSIVMFKTPFSSVCLSGKYAWNDRLSFMAKGGIGTIDYSTISGSKLTSDPVIGGGGIDYVLGGNKTADYYSLVCEYETVDWSINRASIVTNEIMIGLDLGYKTSDSVRTKYRIGVHNFYAGIDNEENIESSVKYSLSTQIQADFNKNFSGLLEGGVYLGDKIGGLISYFGLGMAFDS
jgi:hypothetical protein